MAIITRRYIEAGPRNAQLDRFVSPTAVVTERFAAPICDIQIDDAVAGIVESLDAYMEEQGYRFDSSGNLEYDVIARVSGNAPGTIVGRARVYALTISGITQLFAKADDGTITQLTPAQSPIGYVDGLTLTYVSASTVRIELGQARDKNDKMNLVVAAPILLDIAVAGIGGLDTGVEAANEWYFAHVIGDDTGVLPIAGVLSASQNNPTLPPGYNRSRRVGSVRNQGSNFRDFVSFGTGRSRSVQYRDALSTRQRLTGGAAVAVTAVNCSTVVAPSSQYARLQVRQRGTVEASLYDDPLQLLANAQRTVQAGGMFCDLMRTSAGRDIAYANAAAGGLLDIWVTGYEDTV